MNGLTQLMIQSLLRKRCILYVESSVAFFVLFMLNQEKNQAALEKNSIATESAAFSFSVNLDFNNTFSL